MIEIPERKIIEVGEVLTRSVLGNKKHRFWLGEWEVFHWDKDGRILWSEVIRNALADEGEKYILDDFFRNLNAPATFYLGLCNDALQDTDTLADILNEPVGNGYARQEITRNSTGWPVLALDAGDYQVISKLVTYLATGGSIGPVNTMFLCNVLSGTAGYHYAWAALSQSRTLANGEALGCKIKVKLQ
jgi:hypothetical protein